MFVDWCCPICDTKHITEVSDLNSIYLNLNCSKCNNNFIYKITSTIHKSKCIIYNSNKTYIKTQNINHWE